MSQTPNELRYAITHEWARREEDGTVTVGITDHAQAALGDVVYVDLPEEGDELEQGDEAGEIESVKAVSSIYAPLSGTVVAINEGLEDAPETVNSAPYAGGWLFKLRLTAPAELDGTLDAAAYEAVLTDA